VILKTLLNLLVEDVDAKRENASSSFEQTRVKMSLRLLKMTCQSRRKLLNVHKAGRRNHSLLEEEEEQEGKERKRIRKVVEKIQKVPKIRQLRSRKWSKLGNLKSQDTTFILQKVQTYLPRTRTTQVSRILTFIPLLTLIRILLLSLLHRATVTPHILLQLQVVLELIRSTRLTRIFDILHLTTSTTRGNTTEKEKERQQEMARDQQTPTFSSLPRYTILPMLFDSSRLLLPSDQLRRAETEGRKILAQRMLVSFRTRKRSRVGKVEVKERGRGRKSARPVQDQRRKLKSSKEDGRGSLRLPKEC
jgi:hypothetical protein